MVGSAMAIDLAKNHKVTVADLDKNALYKVKQKCNRLNIQQLDVTNKEILQTTVGQYDLVLCAVPGFLGFETLRTIIKAERNVIDISFFPENALELDELARSKHVTAIVDCGIAPGMDNILLGYHNEKMKITGFECLVGGLPKIRKWPFYYKSPFSPADVIEEYIRPARYVENGKVVVREPLTDCDYVVFDKVGTLESFNSDGLRTLIHTMPHIPYMKEKTLRYPGHVEFIRGLKTSGFFHDRKIEVKGNLISPLDFTSKILFEDWKLGKTEEEFTLMRVTITGEKMDGETEEIVYNLHDEYDSSSGTSSMARTTGYTATAVANLLLEGLFPEKGIIPPEWIGRREACFNYVMNYLEERNIHFSTSSSMVSLV